MLHVIYPAIQQVKLVTFTFFFFFFKAIGDFHLFKHLIASSSSFLGGSSDK
jgi:hypothetical protein